MSDPAESPRRHGPTFFAGPTLLVLVLSQLHGATHASTKRFVSWIFSGVPPMPAGAVPTWVRMLLGQAGAIDTWEKLWWDGVFRGAVGAALIFGAILLARRR